MSAPNLHLTYVCCFLVVCFFYSCKKETITLSDNNAPTVNHIPAVKIENYVNRIFIDLLGREPVDAEMEQEVQTLKNASLAKSAREALITKLQTGTDFIIGDTSYTQAYHQQIYNLAKIRLLEGIGDPTIISEFAGNVDDPADSLRLANVLNSRMDLQNGIITFDEMQARMIHNLVYDFINMNSFNFVNASFDNLLWRYPTNEEFDAGFKMVDSNIAGFLFGQPGQNKADFVRILTSSREMSEGTIIWAYVQLLARVPTTEETITLLEDYFDHKDFKEVQKKIMVTDEYANF